MSLLSNLPKKYHAGIHAGIHVDVLSQSYARTVQESFAQNVKGNPASNITCVIIASHKCVQNVRNLSVEFLQNLNFETILFPLKGKTNTILKIAFAKNAKSWSSHRISRQKDSH